MISTFAAIHLGFGTPQNSLDARRQFARVERLGKIIVGAQLQTDNAIHVFAARGQHQHRDAAVDAQTLENLKPIQAGKHDIQHDQVVAALLRRLQRRVPLMNALHREALALQKLLEQRAQLSIVVDD